MEDSEKLARAVLDQISNSYSKLPWGVKMCGAYPLYKAVDNQLQSHASEEKGLHASTKTEFLMQIGLMCSLDADTSMGDILRRTAHCCAYAEAQNMAVIARGLVGLVDQLVKVS